MNETTRRRALREFLVARRNAVAPADAGFPRGLRRRTQGLRREEVASLAGISPTWYTWLEQGRDIKLSAEALGRIARALRFNASDISYFFSLARVQVPTELARGPSANEPSGQPVLDAFDGPAMIVNSVWDVQEHNKLADIVFDLSSYCGRFPKNHIWRLFMDVQRRSIYVNWEYLASVAIGYLRVVYSSHADDQYIGSLVETLSEQSDDFRRLWSSQTTAILGTIPVELRLPKSEVMTLTSYRLRFSTSDSRILVLLLPADVKSARALRMLASPRRRTSKSRK